jgi:hypothetical protein
VLVKDIEVVQSQGVVRIFAYSKEVFTSFCCALVQGFAFDRFSFGDFFFFFLLQRNG